jgi:hypothetical protein
MAGYSEQKITGGRCYELIGNGELRMAWMYRAQRWLAARDGENLSFWPKLKKLIPSFYCPQAYKFLKNIISCLCA